MPPYVENHFSLSHCQKSPRQLALSLNLSPMGDTVNVAQRMESNGIPGEFQVTAAVYNRLKDKFLFKKHGAVEIKGKGEIMVYLLVGRN